MPNLDGTGPLSKGSLTGRGFGNCGKGIKRGASRGFRRFDFQYEGFDESVKPNKTQQTKILEAHKLNLETELEELKKKLIDLKKQNAKTKKV